MMWVCRNLEKKKKKVAELLILCTGLKREYLTHGEENEDLAKLEEVKF